MIGSRSSLLRSFLTLAVSATAAIALPSVSYAEKPEWLPTLNEEMTGKICSDGGVWLECFHQEAKRCHEIVSSMMGRCLDELSDAVPTDDSVEAASEFGEQITSCFNRAFAERYEPARKNTPECQGRPKHLE
jgi:hypothetical protein